MGVSRRLQVLAGVGAVVLLVAALLLTRDDGAPSASEPTATTPATTPVGPGPTSATDPPRTTATTSPQPTDPRLAGFSFSDVTEAAGLSGAHASGDPRSQDALTGGVAVGDYDEDGDPDVVLTRLDLPTRLLRNDGRGHFTDLAKAAGLASTNDGNGFAAAVFADIDGDGHLDLFLTGAGRGGAALYRNDGRGRFVDRTAAAGLDDLAGIGLAGTASYGAAFDDWNHDGSLDLVVLQWYRQPLDLQLQSLGGTSTRPTSAADTLDTCNLAAKRRAAPAGATGSRSRLLTNDGSGRFTDVTAASGVEVDRIIGFQPQFGDVDGDGWEDLFVTGDYCTSRLYRNDQGRRFVDITESAGVGTDRNGMGSVVDDIDGDGNLDWFITGIAAVGCTPSIPACLKGGNRLYLGDGAGHFTDGTARFGVIDGGWGWGAAAADFDADGHRDLVLTNGLQWRAADNPGGASGPDIETDPMRLWVGGTETPWAEGAASVGLDDRANGKGLVTFDADGDGDLDVLIARTEGDPLLYRNDSSRAGANHWLGLRLRARTGPNRYAIGATVTVDLGDGRPPRLLLVRAGGSFQSGDPTDLHLGLGSFSGAAKVTVRWPDGTTQVVPQVPADELTTITKP